MRRTFSIHGTLLKLHAQNEINQYITQLSFTCISRTNDACGRELKQEMHMIIRHYMVHSIIFGYNIELMNGD